MKESPEYPGNFFRGGWGPGGAGCGGWGRYFPQLLHPGFFLMPQGEPRRHGRPGGGNSHGCYTQEPTKSGWDAGVPPKIVLIIQISYTSIFGRPSSLVLPDPSPHRALDSLGENSNPPRGIRQPARKQISQM